VPKTYYSSNNTLGLWLVNTPITPPSQVRLALFLVSPTPAGGGTEVSGNGYGRQLVAFSTPNNGQCSNTAIVTFPEDITADWGTIVAYGVYDAASGGNLLYYAPLSTPRYVAVNDQVVFPSGQLVASEI
jgi:hypothetical protein